jgi:hypothetical protein
MNLHLAFVGRIALARKKTSLFKPLHQGCDGTRLKREPARNRRNRLAVSFPERTEDQVLRIRYSKRVEHGLVDAVDRHRSPIKRKAKLAIEGNDIRGDHCFLLIVLLS